jgi:hypothetical protein
MERAHVKASYDTVGDGDTADKTYERKSESVQCEQAEEASLKLAFQS